MSRLTEPLPMQQYDPLNKYEHLAVQERDADQVPQYVGYDIPHEVSDQSEVQPIFEMGDRDGEIFRIR